MVLGLLHQAIDKAAAGGHTDRVDNYAAGGLSQPAGQSRTMSAFHAVISSNEKGCRGAPTAQRGAAVSLRGRAVAGSACGRKSSEEGGVPRKGRGAHLITQQMA